MPKTYQSCDIDVEDLIAVVMTQHHPDLAEHKVSVQAVYVSNESELLGQTPAIMQRGHSCAAQIKITSLEQRSRGFADALLTIDTLGWVGMPPPMREALVDHELTHLELVLDKKTESVKIDDLGRPRLKIRHHSWELSGFSDVCERHGENALESKAISRFIADYAQLELFPTTKEKEKP